MTLIVYQDNQEVLRIVTDQFQENLKQLGIGTGNHGFTIRLPLKVCQAVPFKLKIAVANSNYVLENSSIDFAYNTIYKSSLQGALESKIKNRMLRGWALDKNNLDTKVDLYLYDDHNFICKFNYH